MIEDSSSQTPALATSHGAPFDYEAVSEEMESRWPHLFGHGIHLPLKVGITKDLHQEALANGSSLSKRKISLYLERYCKDPRYLRKIADGCARHDINGLAIDDDIQARHVRNANKHLTRLKSRSDSSEG
ncbi:MULTISPECIES: ProQ/FINO family protein [Delftia]|uniref:ProQ/FINO family protein n=1 Tax=Delftia lacustris TaxID=558537 RepID=A0A1H3MY06_9BURK|nr:MULTISPECIES: ProQ/FINO family protein [Delftia]QPS78404.1 hypothetical protein I6G48_32310 [Delftia acidovorans]QPS84964.1 hypothetical protein I6G47_32985 [Delftia lacustris]SDY80839.1 ProQ/FINO family protein [Delftia lacustris]